MDPQKNENSTVYLDEHNVFTIEWKDGVKLEREDLKVVVDTYDEWSQGNDWKVLHLFPKGTKVSADAQSYAELREKPALAEAFVIKNVSQRILFKFYKQFRKVKYPIKDFSNKESAVEWLQTK